MAEKLTPQQEMAVKNRGGQLLVSAAAGSGKTKVLVDRLMDYVLDPVSPADLDEFLIITYTKAAASELRGKIAAKLTEHIARQPENKHLQRQMQRLYLAKISTVHAFCADILREQAYLLDLPADFRVAEENECAQIRETVMERMLEQAYITAQEDAPFRAFVDAQGLGRDDRLVSQILFKVYDSARCHLDPFGWLDQCVANAKTEGLTDASETVWGRYLMDELFYALDLHICALERCIARSEGVDGMQKPLIVLENTVAQLRDLRASRTWDEILARKNIDFGRLTISKKVTDLALGERVKLVRNGCRDDVQKKLKIFADPSCVILEDLAHTAEAVQGLASLVRRFAQEYDRAKKSRRILDFSDLEHRMLDLLLGKSRAGITRAAQELGGRFREIMVDEYQDSNAVQDAIFGALTARRGNCFMVGDVKQSIYQFRLADPTIFLEKYNTYADAQNARDGEGRKVLLSANFRSGGAVLRSVNDIFEYCMSERVGGLRYTESEALREGIAHRPLEEAEVECWGVEVSEDTYREEAAFVARRITQLLDGTHYVRDGDALRPIRPEDIAILLRSPGSVGRYYMDALASAGIAFSSGGGEDLLQTTEVQTLRALLQTLSNPRQDIPLVAAMASPAFGFTADDLARIRSADKKCCMYDALVHADDPKARAFVEKLTALRRQARLLTLPQLIETIFRLTGLDSIFGAMPDGQNRRENLQTFYGMAASFESGGRRDLEHFLEHLQALEEKGMIVTTEQTQAGAVTIMSIHKSKGLEFPVVFVCALAREFNRESSRAHVLCDQKLGIGLSVVDAHNRLRYPTIAKRAIASKTVSDSVSEELRVLYVALTRARDRLIMVYSSDKLGEELAKLADRMGIVPDPLLTGGVKCPGEWVLMSALRRTEAGAFHNLGAKPEETALGDPVWRIGVAHAQASEGGACPEQEERSAVAQELVRRMEQGISYRYAHLAATSAPSKQTATQRKGRVKDAEAAENTVPPRLPERVWREPSFVSQQIRGKDRGNAMHALMQYIPFAACATREGICDALGALVLAGRLTAQEAELIDTRKIAAFFDTTVGKRLIADKDVLREFKFSILEDGAVYDPALAGEEILLQGVVDCAWLDGDGITVLDFKTDRVNAATVMDRAEHYRPQVQAYADALSRIFGLPVKEKLLYFFAMDRFVRL